jgi:hypothetical protein
MSRTARITINAETISPARAIAMAARSAPLLIVSHRAFRDLADELGGMDAGAFDSMARTMQDEDRTGPAPQRESEES